MEKWRSKRVTEFSQCKMQGPGGNLSIGNYLKAMVGHYLGGRLFELRRAQNLIRLVMSYFPIHVHRINISVQ